MLGALIVAALAGVLVYIIASAFDKSPDNRTAGLAGLIVFVLVFLSHYVGLW